MRANSEEYVFPMIKKMTAMPAVMRNSFGTATANMQRAIVRVVEGESSLPAECTPLGICDVELPPFLPKGSPVELTYQYQRQPGVGGLRLKPAATAPPSRSNAKTGLHRRRVGSCEHSPGSIERCLKCSSKW